MSILEFMNESPLLTGFIVLMLCSLIYKIAVLPYNAQRAITGGLIL